MVLGGYVFVPVTANYLSRSGRSNELSYYYQQYYRMEAEEGKTREQLVVLSRVLPDPSTNYRSYRNAIIDTVNGEQPNDFAHFVKLLDDAKDKRAHRVRRCQRAAADPLQGQDRGGPRRDLQAPWHHRGPLPSRLPERRREGR